MVVIYIYVDKDARGCIVSRENNQFPQSNPPTVVEMDRSVVGGSSGARRRAVGERSSEINERQLRGSIELQIYRCVSSSSSSSSSGGLYVVFKGVYSCMCSSGMAC